jgi:hypothetical protein
MRLIPYPDTDPGSVTGIEVEVLRAQDALALTYRLAGRIADLAIPSPASPARADELWKRTCFEAFVRLLPGEAYFEFNFSPSGQWAAYRFDGYRVGMAPVDTPPPGIALETTPGALTLTATLRLPPGPCRLALNAVIEDRAGDRSYWALAHPPGKPDFHHAAGFIVDLA